MSRPKKHTEPRKSTAVRLPVDLHERLRKIAEERDTSVNHLLVKSIAYYLDHSKQLPISERPRSEVVAEWTDEVEALLSDLHDWLLTHGEPGRAGQCVNLLGRLDSIRDLDAKGGWQ